MRLLVCLGLGYSAHATIAQAGPRFDRFAGTVTRLEKAVRIARDGIAGRPVETFVHDGGPPSADLAALLRQASAVLVSAGPSEGGDPFLPQFADALAQASELVSIVYLSTVGVYGDHQGAWIDETAECRPSSQRTTVRLVAERHWSELGTRLRVPVAILRLAGIYGPGQSAIDNLKAGTARRIVKPGQVFNRIHVEDIAQTVIAAMEKRANGVFNVADDEPTPGDVVVAHAAGLMGLPVPPAVDYASVEAMMSPMAKSFYGEVKRIRNDRIKHELGVSLRYPTYREGLEGILRKPR
jgi:hypothetical protein